MTHLIQSWVSKHFKLHKIDLSGFSQEQAYGLRSERLNLAVSNTNVIAASSLIFCTVIGWMFWGRGVDLFIGLWWSGIFSMYGFAIFQNKRRGDTKPISGSLRATNIFIKQVTVLAVIYAAAPFFLLPIANGAEIALMTGYSLCAPVLGAYLICSVPQAAFRWLVISTLLNTISFGMQNQLPLDICACFSLIIAYGVFRACISQSVLLTKQFVGQITLNEKREVIGLLLKEFEDNSGVWLWECDDKGTFTRLPNDLLKMFGYPTPAKMPSINLLDLLEKGRSNTASNLKDRILSFFEEQTTFHELTVPVRDAATQKLHWFSMSGKAQSNFSGDFSGFRGIVTDVTDAKNAEDHIRFLAGHDPLTKLPNRLTFTTEVEKWTHARRRFATLHLDLDKFKIVNDTRGHLIGDELLIEVAKRIEAVAFMASTEAHCCRIGGDEFVIAIPLASDDPDARSACELASNLVSELSHPFNLSCGSLGIGASVGFAIYPDDEAGGISLAAAADLALYRAKAEGRGCWQKFYPEMDESAQQKFQMETDLHTALELGQFSLVYQPLIELENGGICGVEALIRWKHPDHGATSPEDFIPLAEENGSIAAIGAWALHEACVEAASWARPLKISVNVSARQILDRDFVGQVMDVLSETGLPAQRLELELTETVLVQDAQMALKTIKRLRGAGVSVVLDDFGTGYSSLGYLRDFSFDKIKIDKSFICVLSEDYEANDDCDPGSLTLVTAIVNLAKTMGMTITAEGIEDAKQVADLRAMGCDIGQGYWFSRPLPAGDLRDFASLNIKELSAADQQASSCA